MFSPGKSPWVRPITSVKWSFHAVAKSVVSLLFWYLQQLLSHLLSCKQAGRQGSVLREVYAGEHTHTRKKKLLLFTSPWHVVGCFHGDRSKDSWDVSEEGRCASWFWLLDVSCRMNRLRWRRRLSIISGPDWKKNPHFFPPVCPMFCLSFLHMLQVRKNKSKNTFRLT